MFDVLLPKMDADGLDQLIVHLAPFILQHRLTTVTQAGLKMLCSYLPRS